MTDSAQLAFRALADPTRREIIRLLTQQDMSIAALTAHFDMTRAAVKKHLTVLREGGLIVVHPQGRERLNRLDPAGLEPVLDWLGLFDQFWDDRLDRLESVVERSPE